MLEDIVSVGDFQVVVMDELKEKHPDKFNAAGGMEYEWFEKEIRPFNFIYLRRDVNSISFTLQKGPAEKVGVNGCRVNEIIAVAQLIVDTINEKSPCHQTEMASFHLGEALLCLQGARKEGE